ncbi:hypothetical protein KM043_010521 [Ampulex compressa]|nr:hypothetical protein KM043_010521 [Ampulex compressa]
MPRISGPIIAATSRRFEKGAKEGTRYPRVPVWRIVRNDDRIAKLAKESKSGGGEVEVSRCLAGEADEESIRENRRAIRGLYERSAGSSTNRDALEERHATQQLSDSSSFARLVGRSRRKRGRKTRGEERRYSDGAARRVEDSTIAENRGKRAGSEMAVLERPSRDTAMHFLFWVDSARDAILCAFR